MQTVDDYLNDISPQQKEHFERVRWLVQSIVPDADELISYGMPTFKYNGKPLIYFGAFKNHMSLFPTPGPTKTLQDKLVGYKVSKGTIQFTLQSPLPDELIREIILARLTEIS